MTITTSRQSLSSIGTWTPCRIDVLTPVHIGSGIKWRKDFDFIVDEYGTYVIPEALLLEYLEKHPDRISDVTNDEKRRKLLGEIEGGIEYNLYCKSRDLLSFIRNGNGQPYLPGSSLKGGIRTMLFWTFWKQLPERERRTVLEGVFNNQRIRKEWAAQSLVKKLFGKNPNYDLLRALAVDDVFLGQQALELKKVHVLGLTSPDRRRYGWKDLRRRRYERRPEEATPIYAEMIRPGVEAYGALRLDRFLLEDERAERVLKFQKYGLGLQQLVSWANAYAKRRLEREWDFLEACDDGRLSVVLANIKQLLSEVEHAQNSTEHAFLVRLGWGSGWQSMTGDYLEGDMLKRARRRFGLGKRGFPVFPKTRKIVFEHGTPAYISGWIKVTLNVMPPAENVESSTSSAISITSEPAGALSPPEATAEEKPVQLPEGYQTGIIHSVNIKKNYGKVQPDDGGEPLRFELTLAPGLNKGVRVVFKVDTSVSPPQVVDIKPVD